MNNDQPNEFGTLISQKITSESDTFYHHYDALGSTAALTDSSEVVTDEYAFEAFGETAAESGATPNPYQWVAQVGYRKDEETSLYDLRRRSYDASTGRFVSEDPVRSDEENLYRYVGNDPVDKSDPSGLQIPQFNPSPSRATLMSQDNVSAQEIAAANRPKIGSTLRVPKSLFNYGDDERGQRARKRRLAYEAQRWRDLETRTVAELEFELESQRTFLESTLEGDGPADEIDYRRTWILRINQILQARNFDDENSPPEAKKRLWEAQRKHGQLLVRRDAYLRELRELSNMPWNSQRRRDLQAKIAKIEQEGFMLTHITTGGVFSSPSEVRTWSFSRKFSHVLTMAIESGDIPSEIAENLADAISPANLATTAGMFAAVATAHAFPIAGLVIDAALLLYFGTDTALRAYRIYLEVDGAIDEADLRGASKTVAQEIAAAGSDRLIELLTWGAARSKPGRAAFEKTKQGIEKAKPHVKELIKDDSGAFRYPFEPKGGKPDKNKTNGDQPEAEGMKNEGKAVEKSSEGDKTKVTGETDAPKGPLANHPRIANRNPLADKIAAGADPKTVIPDDTVIVRGGQNYTPQQGNVISAQMGSNVSEAAAGLPHGTVRATTAGEIRAAGGTVELKPEPAYPGGPINTWHVNVTEGPSAVFPAEGVSSSVPKTDRLIVPRN